MFTSNIRLFAVCCLIGFLCHSYATAQDKGIGTDELLEEYKSSKGYQQLQAQMGELNPLADLKISFRLYRDSSSERKEVTDSVDNVFLIIEQYPCNTYGANPKLSHFADSLDTYELQPNIWDPNCITIDFESEALGFSDNVEWNPEPFSSDDSEVNQQKTITLDNDYILEVESRWRRNHSFEDIGVPASNTGSVKGTLMYFVHDTTQQEMQTEEPLANTAVNVPELGITVHTDQDGNFEIDEVPAAKQLNLIAQNPHTNSPDTLRFVANPDTVIDMGNLYIQTDE